VALRNSTEVNSIRTCQFILTSEAIPGVTLRNIFNIYFDSLVSICVQALWDGHLSPRYLHVISHRPLSAQTGAFSDSSPLIDPHKSTAMAPSFLVLQALNGPSRSAWVQWRASACFSRNRRPERHFTFCASVNPGLRRRFEIFIKNDWKPSSYESCDSPGKFLSLMLIGFSSNAEIRAWKSVSDRSASTDLHHSRYVITIRRFLRLWQYHTLEISGEIE
jgi:hypothetical protein